MWAASAFGRRLCVSARSPEKRPVWQAWPGHPLLKDSVQPSSVQRGVADGGGLRVRVRGGEPRAGLGHCGPACSPTPCHHRPQARSAPATLATACPLLTPDASVLRPSRVGLPGLERALSLVPGSRPRGGVCPLSSVTAVRCDAVGPGRAGGQALPCRLPPLTQPSAGGRLAGQAAPGDGGSLAPGPRPFFSRVTSAESGIPWASVSPSEVSRRPRGRAWSQDLHPHREEPSARASQKTLPPRPPARAVRAVPVCARRVRDTGPQDAA